MEETSRLRHPAPQPHKQRLRMWILVALLAALIATNVLLFIKYHAAVRDNPLSQQQQLIDTVSQAVIAPHETPVVSTVANERKLTNPALAHVVKNGDKILIYGQAKQLIVYRPSVQKVVTMLTITDQLTTP